MSRAAVVLLSGGLDSATALAFAREQGFTPHAITFDYGQRHRIELERAIAIADAIAVESHTVFPLDLRMFGGSALTADIDVPKPGERSGAEFGDSIPITYVPARNLMFLSVAVALAEVRGALDVFIGVNAVDYSGYPDCRPEFIDAYAKAAGLATRIGVESGRDRPLTIHTPLAGMSKAEIVKLAGRLGVPVELTVSCYDPTPAGEPCNECEACVLRARGFKQAGVRDPAQDKRRPGGAHQTG